MARKPISIEELLTKFVERSSETLTVRLTGARSMLKRAGEYLASGDDNQTAARRYAAITNYHEAARLALTAMILTGGDRLRGGERAHQAVLDYALDRHLISRPEWQVLDDLRQTRNEIEYADDAIEPSDNDVNTVSKIALKLYDEATKRAANAEKSPANKTTPNKATSTKGTRNAAGRPIPPPPPQ